MQILTVAIHNFRSIEDGTFNMGDYCLMIGANNSGKTNVMDALRIFYEKDLKFQPERDFPNFTSGDKESWIDIEYALTPDEYSSLKTEYQRSDSRLKVRKYLQTDQKGDDGKAKLGIFGYVGDDIAGEHFYGAKNVQQGKLGDVIYVPAVSRLDDYTKFSGPSALRDLVNDIVKKLLNASEAFKAFTEHFNAFTTKFKDEPTDDGRSLTTLEKEITDQLTEWDIEFVLNINPLKEGDLVKSLVDHKIVEDGNRLDPGQFGQGFQRHLIFTLIRIAAKYQTPKRESKKKEFAPEMTLLLFEEPEAYLHPTQQRVLAQNLRTIASQEGHQVFASSHSPHFVSHNSGDLPSLVRLVREDRRTAVGQVTADGLQGIFMENQNINDLVKGTKYEAEADDLKMDMEAIKYFLWLDPERCGMFFAGHVLLVEGPSERVLINYLLDEGMIESPRGGIFVLDCLGKFNIHRFINLLGPMKIRHSVMFDDDGGHGVHEKIGELIEGSASEFTYKVGSISGDIEKFLGIDAAKRPHRKPQHMMFKLRDGSISQDRIDALIDVVRGLLPDRPGSSVELDEMRADAAPA